MRVRLTGIPTDVLHAVLEVASLECGLDCLLAMRFTCRRVPLAPLCRACPYRTGSSTVGPLFFTIPVCTTPCTNEVG